METETPVNDPPEKRLKRSKKHSDMVTKDDTTERSTEHRKSRRHKKAKHSTEANPTDQPASSSVLDSNLKQYNDTEPSSEAKPSVPIKKKKKRIRDESSGQKVKSHHKVSEVAPAANIPAEATISEHKHEGRVKRKSKPVVPQWAPEDRGDTRTVVEVGQVQPMMLSPQPKATHQSRSGSHDSSKSSIVSRYSRTPPSRAAYTKRAGSPANTSHAHKRTHDKIYVSPERRRHGERKPPVNSRPRSRSCETSSDGRDAMMQTSRHHKHDRSRELSRHYESGSSYARPSSSSHNRGRYHDCSPRRTFRQKDHYRNERSRSRSSPRRRHERYQERRGTPSRQRHSGREVSRRIQDPDSHGIGAPIASRHSVTKHRAREARDRSYSALAGETLHGKSASPMSANPADSPHRNTHRSNYPGKRPLESRPSDRSGVHGNKMTPTERSPHSSLPSGSKKSMTTTAPSKLQSPVDSSAATASRSRSVERQKSSGRPSSSKVGTVVHLLGELKVEPISDTELHDLLPASMFVLSSDGPPLPTDIAGHQRSSESPSRRRHNHARQDFKFVSDSCDDDVAKADGHYRLATDALEKISQLHDKLGGSENWESTDFSLSPSHPSASNEQDNIVDDLLLPADQSLVAMTTARTASNGSQCSQLLASSLSAPWQELVESATKALSLAPDASNDQLVSFKPINAELNMVNVSSTAPTPNRMLPLSSRANGCLALQLTGVSKKYLGEDLLKCIQQELGQSEMAIPTPTVNSLASLKTGLNVNEKVKIALDAVLPHGWMLSGSSDHIIRLSLLGEVQ